MMNLLRIRWRTQRVCHAPQHIPLLYILRPFPIHDCSAGIQCERNGENKPIQIQLMDTRSHSLFCSYFMELNATALEFNCTFRFRFDGKEIFSKWEENLVAYKSVRWAEASTAQNGLTQEKWTFHLKYALNSALASVGLISISIYLKSRRTHLLPFCNLFRRTTVAAPAIEKALIYFHNGAQIAASCAANTFNSSSAWYEIQTDAHGQSIREIKLRALLDARVECISCLPHSGFPPCIPTHPNHFHSLCALSLKRLSNINQGVLSINYPFR